MFWKKKKVDKTQYSKIILGMVMLHDNKTFNIETFTKDFDSYYSGNIQEPAGDNASFVFTVDKEMVAIAHMPVPIPFGDIEGTAQYAYNWQSALEDTREHKSHLIVSLMQGGQDHI